MFAARRAAADAGIRLSIEWDKLGALLHRDEANLPRESPRRDPDGRPIPPPPAPGVPLLDATQQGAARWSLVARDWEEARLLMGRLAATDQMRGQRSRRMILLRGRLADGPIAPFVQVGLGQWRIDPDMPAMPHDAVDAGQVGVGLELTLTSWASIALESDCTVLNPGRFETPVLPPARPIGSEPNLRDGAPWLHPPTLWGGFIAARATF